jgi:hypothetical protein
MSFLWPGSVCAIMGDLAGGSGEDGAALVAETHQALTRRLQDCFCRSSAVFTDDMTAEIGAPVAETAAHFAYKDLDLAALEIPTARARAVSDEQRPVYVYPADEQRRLCAVVMSAGAGGR